MTFPLNCSIKKKKKLLKEFKKNLKSQVMWSEQSHEKGNPPSEVLCN